MSLVPEVLSVGDAAKVIGVSEQRVRSLLRIGFLQGSRVGKQWVTSANAVRAYCDFTNVDRVPDQTRRNRKRAGLKALSFFSGAMGLDLGLERAGIHVLLACEFDRAARATILSNRPDLGLIGDIWRYSAREILEAANLSLSDEIDVIVGGPPCQAFSTAGARRGLKDHRGNALLRYVDLILELRPRFAVIENVRGLLSAPLSHTPHASRTEDWTPSADELPGGALLHVISRLRMGGYGVSFNLYNAANFGVPQSRERVILLCSRDGAVLPHLSPTHSSDPSFGLPQWKTVRDAFAGMEHLPSEHSEFPESRLRFYEMLGPGEYWKNLPQHLHREALGGSLDSGGGKTGFLRRLAWDKPSCTLVTSPTMPATDICHPVENRPISVQEYMRLQQFPDDWIVRGSLADRYKQIGNAVPVGLGEAVARVLLAHMDGKPLPNYPDFPMSRYRNTGHVEWEASVRARLAVDGAGGSGQLEMFLA